MRHLSYCVRLSKVPINSSLLTITLYSSDRITLVYNDTKYPVPFMTSSTVFLNDKNGGMCRTHYALMGKQKDDFILFYTTKTR
jgi:hypothetical protein